MLCLGSLQAQDSDDSDQTEAREDAYRKQMELKDARNKDTFSNTSYSSKVKQQKIDKLPKESRDNIREQLTEIIINNDQWKPGDILDDYPYEPSETAQGDAGLREQEEEAWTEQIDKYHEREAAAFGASRPPAPGSQSGQQGGNPGGKGQQGEDQSGESESGQQGEGQSGEGGSGQQGEGQEGEEGSAQQGSESDSAKAGSYDPYQSSSSDSSDEVSTAGVSESALDFLRNRQGSSNQAGGQQAQPQQQQAEPSLAQSSASSAEQESQEQQEQQQEQQQEPDNRVIIPGTIAIEDLDKLEGMEQPEVDRSDN